MNKLQFDILFALFVAGAVFLLFADSLGITIQPTALTGYGALTTYVLTQRNQWTKNPPKPKPEPDDEDET